jgi:hypothetical protein
LLRRRRRSAVALIPVALAWAVLEELDGSATDLGLVLAAFSSRRTWAAPRAGLVLTAGAIGGLLGGATGLRWSPSRPLVAAFVLYSFGSLALAALAVPLAVPLIGAANVAYIAGIAAANLIWETTLQVSIPDEVLSRVSSYDWLVSLVMQPVGFGLAGPAADTFGRSTTLWTAASLTAGSMLLILAVPSVRTLRREGY